MKDCKGNGNEKNGIFLPSLMSLIMILAMFWTFCIAQSAEASGSMHKSVSMLKIVGIKENNINIWKKQNTR